MIVGDIVYVRNMINGGYWQGKITEIKSNEITVQDKGINFAIFKENDLILKGKEYWEK